MPDSEAVANSEPEAFNAKAASPDWCACQMGSILARHGTLGDEKKCPVLEHVRCPSILTHLDPDGALVPDSCLRKGGREKKRETN